MEPDAIRLAVIAQQVADLTRRVGTLEAQFWAIILLLVANLWATISGQRRVNGSKERAS